MDVFAMNVPGMSLERLQERHIDEIIQLMNKEGWYYYDYHELKRYLDLNQDCFVLLKDGQVAGSIFTTNYDNQAWIGNVIVAEESRGMGLASTMLNEVIRYLGKNKGLSTFRLGSVPLAIGVYKKAGFRPEAFTTAQQAELPLKIDVEPESGIQVEEIGKNDLDSVAEIDALYFGSNRKELLAMIYNDSEQKTCLCIKEEGRVVGYLMARRRKVSKTEAGYTEGPDNVYRIGPSCVLPEYGVNGFKALFYAAAKEINEDVAQLQGTAHIYVVFPRNADKKDIYADTVELAKVMEMDIDDMESVFNEHDHIFGVPGSRKNEELWRFMESMGFQQEYFEQVMSYTPGEAVDIEPALRKSELSKADPEGIYATATPGDKA